MSEHKSSNFRGDVENRRPVLGDVTNQLGDRGFRLVTREPGSKPLSGNKRAVEIPTDNGTRFDKRVCLGVENVEKERVKCTTKVVPKEVRLSPLRGGKTYRLQTSSRDGSSGRDVINEIKEPFSSGLDSIDLGENQHLTSAVNVDSKFESSGKYCVEVEKERENEETRGISDLGESDFSPVELGTQVMSDDGKSVGGDCMTSSSRSDSVETLKISESRSFGLERCTLLKGDCSDNLAAGVDLLKTCSCSFCTKAGYIWADLQCQDIKGRISTLGKSQKEASNLAQRYSSETMVEAQGRSSIAPHLQTDLTTLWKSLFVHMDNIYTSESTQLQSNLATLNDLREDYKMNLEMINVLPPEVQQCSSDSSGHKIN